MITRHRVSARTLHLDLVLDLVLDLDRVSRKATEGTCSRSGTSSTNPLPPSGNTQGRTSLVLDASTESYRAGVISMDRKSW